MTNLITIKEINNFRADWSGWFDGEIYFRFPGKQKVYVKNCYIREEKKYSISPVDDMNRERLVKGSTIVEIGFTY